MSKPKNLNELVEQTFNLPPGGQIGYFLANDAGTDIMTNLHTPVPDDVWQEFRQGNYHLPSSLLKTMEVLGQKLIDQASKDGIAISDLAEFKNADFNKDKHVDAKEVGALILASCMDVESDGNGGALNTTKSDFRCKLGNDQMAKLLNPEQAYITKLIANKLLQDNGVTVANPQTDEEFRTIVADPKLKGVQRLL